MIPVSFTSYMTQKWCFPKFCDPAFSTGTPLQLTLSPFLLEYAIGPTIYLTTQASLSVSLSLSLSVSVSVCLSLFSLSIGYHLCWFQSFYTVGTNQQSNKDISIWANFICNSFQIIKPWVLLFLVHQLIVPTWCMLLVTLSTLFCPMILLLSYSQPRWLSLKSLHRISTRVSAPVKPNASYIFSFTNVP